MNIFKKLSMVAMLALLLGASDAGSVMAAGQPVKDAETKDEGIAEPFRLLAMQDQALGFTLGFLTLQDLVAASNSCGRVRRVCMQPSALVLGDRMLAQPAFLDAVPDQEWLCNLCKRYFASLIKRADFKADVFYSILPEEVQLRCREYMRQCAIDVVAITSEPELRALPDTLLKRAIFKIYHERHGKYLDAVPQDWVELLIFLMSCDMFAAQEDAVPAQ